MSDEEASILLSPPDVGELEEQYIISALRSGWAAPAGPDLAAFEHEMSQRIGVGHAVALASGTAALHLVLLALGVGQRDVVVTSTLTFVATANAISYTGAVPFFVDCDPQTGNIDPDLLRSALGSLRDRGENVAAVLPVDLLGKCADYDRIEEVCTVYGVPVVSDAAESVGASYQGRQAGSLGAAAAISFNGNKIMTTSGGGMLLTNDATIASRARYLATQARSPVQHYEHEEIGYNYRLSNLLAAVGRAQLRRLDTMIGRRREVRCRYKAALSDTVGAWVLGGQDDERDNCWLTALVVDPHRDNSVDDLRDMLSGEQIETRPMWKPMHQQPAFRKAGALTNGASDRIFEHSIVLPSGSGLQDSEVERVVAVLRRWIN